MICNLHVLMSCCPYIVYLTILNRLASCMIASGSDDGTFSIRDLRLIKVCLWFHHVQDIIRVYFLSCINSFQRLCNYFYLLIEIVDAFLHLLILFVDFCAKFIVSTEQHHIYDHLLNLVQIFPIKLCEGFLHTLRISQFVSEISEIKLSYNVYQ